MPVTIYLGRKQEVREPEITECPECGKSWSDGRTYCNHDHCDRVSPHRVEHLMGWPLSAKGES